MVVQRATQSLQLKCSVASPSVSQSPFCPSSHFRLRPFSALPSPGCLVPTTSAHIRPVIQSVRPSTPTHSSLLARQSTPQSAPLHALSARSSAGASHFCTGCQGGNLAAARPVTSAGTAGGLWSALCTGLTRFDPLHSRLDPPPTGLMSELTRNQPVSTYVGVKH